MPTESRCPEIEGRLTEAFLARREPEAADAAHAEGCARCGRARVELQTLSEVLDSLPEAEPSPVRALATLTAATAELRGARLIRSGRTTPALAPGFGRELGRLLAFAALPIPLLALWYSALLRFGGAFLAEWLPDFLVAPIGLAFGLSAASWLGLVYASIPVVADRRARRHLEVTT